MRACQSGKTSYAGPINFLQKSVRPRSASAKGLSNAAMLPCATFKRRRARQASTRQDLVMVNLAALLFPLLFSTQTRYGPGGASGIVKASVC